MKKGNNHGFSVIELVVVVALIITAGGIAVGSFSSVFHARSNKAAITVDGMIAQSKINAMSNKNNYFEMYYDSDEECYVCELVYKVFDSATGKFTEKKSGGKNEYYERTTLGNDQLDVIVDGHSLKDNGGILRVSFNMDTGAVGSFGILSGGSFISKKVPGDTMKIYFSSYSKRYIELYSDTGNHMIKVPEEKSEKVSEEDD